MRKIYLEINLLPFFTTLILQFLPHHRPIAEAWVPIVFTTTSPFRTKQTYRMTTPLKELPQQQQQQQDTLTKQDEGTKISKNKLRKLSKKTPEQIQQEREWKKVVQDFHDILLDPSFLVSPVRSSTIQAAKEYPLSNRNRQERTLMPGTHKHLGGAYDPTDGCIYGVPANAKSIMCLSPIYSNNTDDNNDNNTELVVTDYKLGSIPLPPSIADCRFKWLRGIFAHGCLWAIPAWANAVLCVNVDKYWGRTNPLSQDSITNDGNVVTLIDLPPEYKLQQQQQEIATATSCKNRDNEQQQWQWHGAGMNHEKTAIYCIPSNAQAVLKVDLLKRQTSLIPITVDLQLYPDYDVTLTNKWYGGIVGVDNCVYGIPYRSTAVLQIDCRTDTATLVGPHYGNHHYYWHGGIMRHGKIYAHPSHADTVLVIDTNINHTALPQQQTAVIYELPIHNKDNTNEAGDRRNNYKWLGGAVGADGNIYCPACDCAAALKIDTQSDTCTAFGFAGTLKNKWQGGILGRDGCVYCIPASGHEILRILTVPNQDNVLQLVGKLPHHKDKWQGGYQGMDGSLYFIPENAYRVLKVTPPPSRPTVVDGKLPDDDVLVEFI